MGLKLRPAAGLALAAVAALGGSAQAQATGEKTMEGAHAFIIQMLTTGTSTFPGQTTGGDYSDDAAITVVASSGCATTLYGRAKDNGKTIHRYIDWSVVSQIFSYRGGVEISGAIRTTDGAIIDNIVVNVDSYGSADRLAAAMNFIHDHCDGTKAGGW